MANNIKYILYNNNTAVYSWITYYYQYQENTYPWYSNTGFEISLCVYNFALWIIGKSRRNVSPLVTIVSEPWTNDCTNVFIIINRQIVTKEIQFNRFISEEVCLHNLIFLIGRWSARTSLNKTSRWNSQWNKTNRVRSNYADDIWFWVRSLRNIVFVT